MYNLQSSKETVEKNLPVQNITINYYGVPPTPTPTPIASPKETTQDLEPMEEELLEGESIEEPNAEPDNISIYSYDTKKYYIDNEKYLQKDFSSITDFSVLQMCIYKCVRNGCTPYLQYLLMYDPTKNAYVLPRNNLIIEETIMDEPKVSFSNEDPENIEKMVLEKINELLFFIFPPQPFQPIDSDDNPTELFEPELFKGFHYNDENNQEQNELTMVYDATRIPLPFSTQKKYIWVSPYEIFISKSVKEQPIDDSVRSIFLTISENQPDFYHLKMVEEGEPFVKTPYILFMCKENENGDKSNVYHPFVEPILYPQIQEKRIGSYTFFSNKQILSENGYGYGYGQVEVENPENLVRFAVFIDNDDLKPLFIEPDETANEKLNHLYSHPTEQYSSIIYMDEKDNQLFCVKSPYYFSKVH